MTFRLRRASGFGALLTPEEVHTMTTLEQQSRWIELEEYERLLRQSDDAPKEIKIEVSTLDDLMVWLSSMLSVYPVTIDFEKKTMVIQDNGDVVN